MKTLFLATACAFALGTGAVSAQSMPFGTPEDAAYADLIWQAAQALKLVGPGMIRTAPYEGTDPHGMMLETFYTTATIDGHTGDLIVKRNFGPEGVDADTVLTDPAHHLGAYTVMFRREAGYDPDNKDWFWAKYLPDGSLDANPKGMALAGRVAKGMETGCIACHTGAGEDRVFTTDHLSY